MAFTIETDDEEVPTRSFAVVASLIPNFEMDQIEECSVTIGKPSRQRWRVVCRRLGDQGLSSPETVEVSPPLTAHFVSTAQTRQLPDGVIEETRELEVVLPASVTPGQ